MGHSHPVFNCYYCGAISPWQFARDDNGNLLLNEKGNSYYIWVGWKYK